MFDAILVPLYCICRRESYTACFSVEHEMSMSDQKVTATSKHISYIALYVSASVLVCLMAHLYYSKGSPTKPVSFIWEKCMQSCWTTLDSVVHMDT